MSRFTLPRDIYYGPGALDELKVLAGHKKAAAAVPCAAAAFCRKPRRF